MSLVAAAAAKHLAERFNLLTDSIVHSPLKKITNGQNHANSYFFSVVYSSKRNSRATYFCERLFLATPANVVDRRRHVQSSAAYFGGLTMRAE